MSSGLSKVEGIPGNPQVALTTPGVEAVELPTPKLMQGQVYVFL